MDQRIAFVCQRYGLEVNGGAELYCREIAEKLSKEYKITVYTTCAVDYVTWKNEYDPGTSDLNGICVKRYPVEAEREQEKFGQVYSRMLQSKDHGKSMEEEWIKEQGPYCPGMISAIQKEADQYLAVLFVTYLYYPAIEGLRLNLPNAILIPTVHDEPPVYFSCYDQVFLNAKGIAWNTPEERAFAWKRFPGVREIPSEMTGIGIEKPIGVLSQDLPAGLHEGKYLLYAGRIDESKGCKELINYFLAYKQRYHNEIKLVLIGKNAMPVPESSDIVYLGFVSEEMKFFLMEHSLALTLLSHFESLSMVVLESMLMKRPVLVSAKCEVLKGHCIRSNAGLYIENYAEFAESVQYLLNHKDVYNQMRENGVKYVEENYQWDTITRKYNALIQKVSELQSFHRTKKLEF